MIPAGDGNIRTLFLLHAVAWPVRDETAVGTIRVRGRNGRETSRNVVFRRDVENWWMPGTVPNGTVAWSAFHVQAPGAGRSLHERLFLPRRGGAVRDV